MDYPKSVAGVNLLNGKFTDGNAAQGVAASLDPSAWANAVTDSILNVQTAAGLAAVEGDATQLLTAIKALLQQQTVSYAVDSGAANAYVVALNPAITQQVPGMRLWVKIGNTNTGASTLNAGAGAKNITLADGSALSGGELIGGATYCFIDTGAAYMFHSTRGRLLNIQYFEATGTHTYNPTPGTRFVIPMVLAGGGAGGGAQATGAGQFSIGGGAGAGGWARKKISAAFSGVSVTVGVGGTPVAGGTGGNGGTSSFGSFMSATGGFGGTALAPTTNGIITGASGSSFPLGGDLNVPGMSGGFGVCLTSFLLGGTGGSTPWGQGGGGNGTTGVGGTAAGYGAGGGGASAQPSQGAQLGGPGAPGLITVEEYA